MKEIFKSKSFWIGFILLAGVIYVALINFNRVYKTESQILIIPQSEEAASNSRQIIKNFKVIPTTLSFFEKTAKNNEDVASEDLIELPDYKRKNYWNSKIKTEVISDSGIIRIISSDKDQYQSEIINREIVKEILATAGIYYNIRKDINVRIIDGPITQYSYSNSKTILASESLLIGFILVYLSYLVPFLIFKKREEEIYSIPNISEIKKIKKDGGRKHIFEEEKAWFNIYTNTKNNLSPEEKKINLKNENNNLPQKPESISFSVGSGKKASAPDNLPVAEILNIQEISKKESSKPQEVIEKEFEKTPITREATPEEVKERLNKLLSGKL